MRTFRAESAEAADPQAAGGRWSPGAAARSDRPEIAAELYLAPGTVKNHVANIQRKLGTPNRVGIAAWVLTRSAP